MARPPKNPRIRAEAPRGSPTEPGPDPETGAGERRERGDRRQPGRGLTYTGVDRRERPRRSLDLPRPVWQRPIAVGFAIALGVAAGLTLGSVRPTLEPAAVDQVDRVTPGDRIEPQLRAGVEALRDEAEALTPASLDERARERWTARVAAIERALADPATPESIREELVATLDALARAGLL